MIERRDLPRPPGAVLAMLLLVYIFNFLDRQILAILAAPIQADLGLSDAQMGLLGGIAFALLYSTLAVPLHMPPHPTPLVLWPPCAMRCEPPRLSAWAPQREPFSDP